MKVVEFEKYGLPEVLHIKDVEKPVPGANEILLRIHATTVTATECTFRKGKPFVSRLFVGLTKPKIKRLGEELSGEIEEVGEAVKMFKKGDKVFGTAGPTFGANAEYICIPDDGVLAIKPENMTYEEAAASVDGFLTAMPFLRDTGKIKKGQRVLIYGASGSVGAAAVQVAKYFETEVTGVCSTANVEMVKGLGADNVVDYKKDDFTKSNQTYDLIFDAVGKASFSKSKGSLAKGGVFLEAGFGFGTIATVLWTAMFGNKKMKIAATGLRKPAERTKDLVLLKQLIETGKIKPVVDKSFPLEQIVEAHRYVDKGHKKGNVAITVAPSV